jgi:hypothetical protein
MGTVKKVKLSKIDVKQKEIKFIFEIDTQKSRLKINYENINFESLKQEYGDNSINSLIVQMGAFSGIKYCSLFPEKYDISKYSEYITEDFLKLFHENYDHVFVQHRYQNNKPQYQGPEIVVDENQLGQKHEITKIDNPNNKIIFGCGGGKDSLISMRLFERADEKYSIFHYSHSIYGNPKKQEQLIQNLTEITEEQDYHPIEIEEEFLSENQKQILKNSDSATICDAETPKSLFWVLPIMLENNYKFVSLGHEKSADTGNFYWESEDREVNHQWGKSYEAEKIYRKYIRTNLVKNIDFFSVLKPIYDYLIFHLLKKDEEHIKRTHSCNIKKPWCKRCPKCAYVWMNLMAYFDKKKVDLMFEENLFKVKDLRDTFLKLVGLKGNKPLECVGEIEEAQLAMFKCYEKGIKGEVMDIFKDKLLKEKNFSELEEKYSKIYETRHFIPDFLEDKIVNQFESVK